MLREEKVSARKNATRKKCGKKKMRQKKNAKWKSCGKKKLRQENVANSNVKFKCSNVKHRKINCQNYLNGQIFGRQKLSADIIFGTNLKF